MLVFDRMARGLRLSIALEARLARERRWDAREIEQGVERGAEPEAGREAAGAPPGRARDAYEAEPGESDREHDDDGLPATAPLPERIGRLKAIIEGAGAPEVVARPARAERRALALQRAERARRAACALPPDEPWDVLGPPDLWDLDLSDHELSGRGLSDHDRVEDGLAGGGEPPWRGAG
jgi:hypothetical protein